MKSYMYARECKEAYINVEHVTLFGDVVFDIGGLNIGFGLMCIRIELTTDEWKCFLEGASRAIENRRMVAEESAEEAKRCLEALTT